tara:strand:- start:19 stop:315 length:297 start_codon:yes stop_codon:yes gene_type:complete
MATISSKTTTDINAVARAICSFIMRKALDIITIVTGILMLGILGGGFFTYKYVSSEQFKAKIMNSILGEVKGLLPNVMNNALPKTTGDSLPMPKKLGL